MRFSIQKWRHAARGMVVLAAALPAAAASAQPCEPRWVDQFPTSEIREQVRALAVFDDGAGPILYAGGTFFSDVGGIDTRYVARWDGTRWSALGDVPDRHVTGMAIFDDGSGPALYVEGPFEHIGDQPIRQIARWDGIAWSAVGTGVLSCGAIRVLDDGSGPALYAQCHFMRDDVMVPTIARWRNQDWEVVAPGAPNVNSIALFDDGSGRSLYIGGSFGDIGGMPMRDIARWDGRKWHDLGGGIGSPGSIAALAVFDDGFGSGPALYAAGNFATAGGLPATNIARWDGVSWSEVGGGLDGRAFALAVHDDGASAGPALYVTGEFESAGGKHAPGIARWDGLEWSRIGTGLCTARALASLPATPSRPATLYAGAGPHGPILDCMVHPPGERIATWDGASWSTLAPGPSAGQVRAVVSVDAEPLGPAIFAGGSFLVHGGRNGARWDGERWSPLIRTMEGIGLNAMAVTEGGAALVAGGNFTSIDGVAASNIARWDGAEWRALGEGTQGEVNALVEFADGSGAPLLVAGGAFHAAGAAPAGHVASWNGSTWAPLGGGVGGRGAQTSVFDIAVFNDGRGDRPVLYVAGCFATAGDVPALGVARWDGLAWSAVGDGLDGCVRALAVFDEGPLGGRALYAAGWFESTGDGTVVNGTARWSGSSWEPIGEGLESVADLIVFDDGLGARPSLFAVGDFDPGGGNSDKSWLARLARGSWTVLHAGSGDAYAGIGANGATVFDDGLGHGPALFIGGQFHTAGGIGAHNMAKYAGCPRPPFIGDVDGDGAVGLADLDLVLGAWGPCPASPRPCDADLDGDGDVGVADLLILLHSWS